jgi:hypothetical protein
VLGLISWPQRRYSVDTSYRFASLRVVLKKRVCMNCRNISLRLILIVALGSTSHRTCGLLSIGSLSGICCSSAWNRKHVHGRATSLLRRQIYLWQISI